MSKSVRILAFDIGSHLGYAESMDGAIIRSGTLHVKQNNEDWGSALIRYERWLTQIMYNPDIPPHHLEIIYEKIIGFGPGGTRTAEVYGMLVGRIIYFAACLNAYCRGYKPSTLKKVFTGKGNADKYAMCARAHDLGWRSGRRGTDMDADEADACALIFCHNEGMGRATRFMEDVKQSTFYERGEQLDNEVFLI